MITIATDLFFWLIIKPKYKIFREGIDISLDYHYIFVLIIALL